MVKLLFQAALLHTPCNTIESGGRHKSARIEQMRGIKPLVGEERSLSFITRSGRESLGKSEKGVCKTEFPLVDEVVDARGTDQSL